MIALAIAGFFGLLAALWVAAKYFGVAGGLDAPTVISCALLLAPYWAFGFGTRLKPRVLMPQVLLIPYLVFAIPRHQFRWEILLGLSVVLLAVMLLLKSAGQREPGWRDAVVLSILALAVEIHFFDRGWAVPGVNGMPKLLFVDAGLYGYLVLRPIGGVGYDFRARFADLRIGLREFLLYTPIAIALGFAMGFLHFHRTAAGPIWFVAAWIFTVFFIAVPEELFFRGLMLNMLESRLGPKRALLISSVIFGLAHFNKRAAYFNWRYVILAAIAGWFYGRAWMARRRIAASSITHATVDTVWSIWLR